MATMSPLNSIVWAAPIAGGGTVQLVVVTGEPLPADSVADLERLVTGIEAWRTAHALRCFTLEDDGLERTWGPERVWCNPPYSQIKVWVQKAWREFEAGTPLIVMLLPANRPEQGWWQELVEPFRDRPGSALRVEFLRGRQRFVMPGAEEIGPNERPPFGCCLLIWETRPASFAEQAEWVYGPGDQGGRDGD